MHLVLWALAVACIVRPAAAREVEHDVAQHFVTPTGIEALAQISQDPRRQDDPAESLYRRGIAILQGGDLAEAANLFKEIVDRYPNSKYVAEALYWRAFALHRYSAANSNYSLLALNKARESLRQLRQKFPREFKAGDAPGLEQRVLGELARRGDADAARVVMDQAGMDQRRRVRGSRGDGPQAGKDCNVNTGDDVQILALNSLVQMDAARALPTLREVLGRRDKGSVCLRRAAIFLLAQRRTEGTETLLLNAVRSDPDLEVRKQAMLYLSQFGTERSVSALDSIVNTVKDSELVASAIAALSRSNTHRAKEVLRAHAERDGFPKELQRQIVVEMLRNPENNTASLRKLYDRLGADDLDLRRQIILGVSQRADSTDLAWLFGITRKKSEPIELRIEAFSRGAGAAPRKERVRLYAPTLDRQLRTRLVEIYARHQAHDAVLDELGEVARRDPDADLRSRAISLISQSQTPHAAQVLREIVKGE